MRADGSDRRVLSYYGRPRWSPNSRQVLIVDFQKPRNLKLMDIPVGQTTPLTIAEKNIFWEPIWTETRRLSPSSASIP